MSPLATIYDTSAFELPPPIPPSQQEPSPSLKDFPTNYLPKALREMVGHAARQNCAPESLCAVAGLGAAAASVGHGLVVQSGPATTTSANLFLLAFAESGTGKGRAFNVMLAPYFAEAARRSEHWEKEIHPMLRADLDAATADLERGRKDRKNAQDTAPQAEAVEIIRQAQRDIQEAEAAIARRPVFNIGNATAEAISERLAWAPGEAGAIFSAEGRDIVDVLLGRYSRSGKGGSDEPIFLQGYSGDPVEYNRKGKASISLRHPCLTLCLAVQPDIWQRLSSEPSMMESGLLARCLIHDAKAPPARPTTHIIPAAVSGAWESTLLSLLPFRDEPDPPRTVVPTAEARAVIDALANRAADERMATGKWVEVKAFAARLAENAWRIALTLHAVLHGAQADKHDLSLATAQAAAVIASWFFDQTLVLLNPLRADRRAARLDKLLHIFIKKSVGELPLHILRENHGFYPDEIGALAAEYPARLRVLIRPPGPAGGRPAEMACIAPFTD